MIVKGLTNDGEHSRPMFDQWIRADDFSPEQKMWRVVLLIFLQDFQHDVNCYHESLNGIRAELWKKVETHLYHMKHPWAEEICSMAGIPYGSFLVVVDEILQRERSILVQRHYDS